MLRKIITAVFSLAIVGIFTLNTDNVRASEAKIGIMDIQKIVTKSEAGKKAKVTFEEKMKEFQAKITQEEEALVALQEEIEKKSSAWSEDVKEKKMREFQKKRNELQSKSEDANFEMKQLQDKELEPILIALETVVIDFGKENGYTLLLDSKVGVLYAEDSADVSDEITKKLNETMMKKELSTE